MNALENSRQREKSKLDNVMNYMKISPESGVQIQSSILCGTENIKRTFGLSMLGTSYLLLEF